MAVFSICATKKLLKRVKGPVLPSVSEPTTILGNWHANALFWKPQVALLVNNRTLLPVLMPLAPAATLLERFPDALQQVLKALGVSPAFIKVEIDAMAEGQYATTTNRSVIGSMNEFRYQCEAYRDSSGVRRYVHNNHYVRKPNAGKPMFLSFSTFPHLTLHRTCRPDIRVCIERSYLRRICSHR